MKPGTQRDEELWNDFIGGSREAFRLLYEHYSDPLFAFGLKYTSDPELVKDCIHDLFVDLHTYRNNLSRNVNVRFYLLRSFRRRMAVLLKKAAALGASLEDSEFALEYNVEYVALSEENEKETLRSLFREIDQLPPRQKEALYLRFHQELTYDEVAVLMKISIATCRTLVYRAIKQLRQNLQNQPVYQVLMLFC